jgi:alpha-amylase/alpha-mannosidase (GH57 family)
MAPMMTNRYLCIHGHFYQPPRENPWLEAIEQQDSAYPYHDWNERITAESYGPNAEARILDERDRIGRIVNNYSRISFNFGPTLLEWMRSTPATPTTQSSRPTARASRASATARPWHRRTTTHHAPHQ